MKLKNILVSKLFCIQKLDLILLKDIPKIREEFQINCNMILEREL
jgi:hypothetical protein